MFYFYLFYALPGGFVLYVTACLLPVRWLWLYAMGVVVCLYLLHPPPEGCTLGCLVYFFICMCAVMAAVLGIVARLSIAALRHRGVRWRYAWWPAPVLFIVFMIAPFFTGWDLLRP